MLVAYHDRLNASGVWTIQCVPPNLRHRNLTRKIKLLQFLAPLMILGKKSSKKVLEHEILHLNQYTKLFFHAFLRQKFDMKMTKLPQKQIVIAMK